jgi:3'-phosphoadenosine 5'-phosphosulfate sulfotransferase (PAPS reductase)/FAD synthetase
MEVQMIIVALSGGKASAFCADWALKHYPAKQVILYFNDTQWEHPDLHRFLGDLELYFKHKIIRDNDGRSVEQLFYDCSAIANNMMPFCSRILKAERLQKYYKDGDTLVFGIGPEEIERAYRLVGVYQKIAAKTGKYCKLIFPLIHENVIKTDINEFFKKIGILEPELYRLGFLHNNCSGGCVRAGKKHWKLLYEKLPEIYLDRERVEREVRAFLKKDVHIFKDETLEEFRGRIIRGELSHFYDSNSSEDETECIGICSTIA